MTLTITYIRLKSLWGFFKLSWFGLKISQQAKSKKGFIQMKNTGLGYHHYTLSAWETEADMKAFAYSEGIHKEAMKESKQISTEIRTYTFEGEQIPSWEDAKIWVAEKGKVLRF